MRLRVLPGSLWLAYTAREPAALQARLPRGFELASAPLLSASTDDRIKLLFNAYQVQSRFMNGHRVDVQVLATDAAGALHLVVLDCVSDTLLWDPTHGIRPPNARRASLHNHATSYRFEIAPHSGILRAHGPKAATRSDIGVRFAVDANRQVYFGDSPTSFPMRFNETAIRQPVRRLPACAVQNTLWADAREAEPTHAFVHEHAMDFWVDVQGLRPPWWP